VNFLEGSIIEVGKPGALSDFVTGKNGAFSRPGKKDLQNIKTGISLIPHLYLKQEK